MNSASEAALAWDLAEAAETFTRREKRTVACALIGAGAHSAAIQQLLTLFIDANVALPPNLVRQAHRWVDGYTGCDNEPALRALVNIAAAPDHEGARRSRLYRRVQHSEIRPAGTNRQRIATRLNRSPT